MAREQEYANVDRGEQNFNEICDKVVGKDSHIDFALIKSYWAK